MFEELLYMLAFEEEMMTTFTIQAYNEVLKQIGVCCFSLAEMNLSLWALYADKHRGVCIGYDLFTLLREYEWYPLVVDYKDEYPKVSVLIFFGTNIDQIALGRKSTFFEYEKEFRIIIPKNGKAKIHKKSISQVIFGCKTDSSDMKKIKEIINISYGNSKILQSKMVPNKYELEFINDGLNVEKS